MTTYLLDVVGKVLQVIVISFISFFGLVKNETKEYTVNNIEYKNSDITHIIVPYETTKTYNSSLPTGETKIVVPGVNGFILNDGTTEKIIQEAVTEVLEVGTGKAIKYTGIISGYGPDCKGCSKVGNVACHTKSGGKHSLINDGIYYQDETYGEIRILSAYREIFPCGTIIEISNYLDGEPPIVGVVLDTGATMRNVYKKDQTVWIDLAYANQNDAGVLSKRSNVNYEVKRWGW